MKTALAQTPVTLGALTGSIPAGLPASELKGYQRDLLPESHAPYTDKYFLRTKEILQKEGINPYVTAQVFIRKGPGEVYGVNEALAIIEKYAPNLVKNGVVYAKQEGEKFEPKEALLVIQGRVQDFVELETIYLGVIAAATSRYNEGVSDEQIVSQVKGNVEKIVKAAGGRPVIYMGARHWDFKLDQAIADAAFAGGAAECSTDIGAKNAGKSGVGTIPHALENAFAYKYGKDRAVVAATLAFDKHMPAGIPRVALIDYNNKEIDDSIATCQAFKALGKKLDTVRVDTCGENVAQGATKAWDAAGIQEWKEQGLALPDLSSEAAKYWVGTGVTVTGVYKLRQALDKAGFADTKILLTSGFGSLRKLNAFLEAEQILGVKLFDALGVGGVFKPVWTSTMDIVEAGESLETLKPMSKVGRVYRPNPELKIRLGGNH